MKSQISSKLWLKDQANSQVDIQFTSALQFLIKAWQKNCWVYLNLQFSYSSHRDAPDSTVLAKSQTVLIRNDFAKYIKSKMGKSVFKSPFFVTFWRKLTIFLWIFINIFFWYFLTILNLEPLKWVSSSNNQVFLKGYQDGIN